MSFFGRCDVYILHILCWILHCDRRQNAQPIKREELKNENESKLLQLCSFRFEKILGLLNENVLTCSSRRPILTQIPPVSKRKFVAYRTACYYSIPLFKNQFFSVSSYKFGHVLDEMFKNRKDYLLHFPPRMQIFIFTLQTGTSLRGFPGLHKSEKIKVAVQHFVLHVLIEE